MFGNKFFSRPTFCLPVRVRARIVTVTVPVVSDARERERERERFIRDNGSPPSR